MDGTGFWNACSPKEGSNKNSPQGTFTESLSLLGEAEGCQDAAPDKQPGGGPTCMWLTLAGPAAAGRAIHMGHSTGIANDIGPESMGVGAILSQTQVGPGEGPSAPCYLIHKSS